MAARHHAPGIAPLGAGQIGMPFQRFVTETGLESLAPLCSEGDFRQQNQRLFAFPECGGNGFEIDLGLT